MRLLNVETLELKEFLGHGIPRYAILSHTWAEEEVMLQDISKPEAQQKKGYAKILGCREQAKMDGLEWIWVDTCCIDKTSSAELSEAINSMFEWYKKSEVCYAYLQDVPPLSPFFPEEEFRKARWFTRGWCLQELLAPSRVEFYSTDWTDIGTKHSLYSLIEVITGIEKEALLNLRDFGDFNLGQKMSWAADRNTTRLEDEAYCLLGIFQINMPLLYGEGERAFLRLQEELLRQNEDYSLLLWTENWFGIVGDFLNYLPATGVLSRSPRFFHRASGFEQGRCDFRQIVHFTNHDPPVQEHMRTSSNALWHPPQMTSRGLRIHTYTLRDAEFEPNTQVLLWTGYIYRQQYICITLNRQKGAKFETYGRIHNYRVKLVDEQSFDSFQLEELYLRTKLYSETKSSPELLPTPRNPRHLEIILRTNCKSTIALNEACYSPSQFDTKFVDEQLQIIRMRPPLRQDVEVHLQARGPAQALSEAENNCMNIIVVVEYFRTSRSPLRIFSVKGTHYDFNDEQDSDLHDRKLVQLLDGTFMYLALKETNILKETRTQCSPSSKLSDEETDLYSEFSDDSDAVTKLFHCPTLYVTLLASGKTIKE